MNQGMINKLRKIQEEMEEAQARIEGSEFEGRATGVVVIAQGTRQIVDVQIQPEMLEDIEILQEVIALAVNDALSRIDQETERVMSKYASMAGMF